VRSHSNELFDLLQMKDSRDAVKNYKASKSSAVSTLPLILDVDDFKVGFKTHQFMLCRFAYCLPGLQFQLGLFSVTFLFW
jgi:hypothetical protein